MRGQAHSLNNLRGGRVCFWLQADIQSPEMDFRCAPNSGHSSADVRLRSRSRVEFFWKFSEPIMARGCFVGLFLRGVAPAGHFNGSRDDGGAAAWHLVETGKVSFAPKDAGRVACGSHKTLSALGRWFGFGQDQIFSGLVGSAGCKIPGLVWVYHYGRYGSSL